MPSIAFHFNAPSKLAYTCRLLRKAVANSNTVAVTAGPELLRKLDEQLWSFSALDFLPHGIYEMLSEQQRSSTAIFLCQNATQGQGRQILVNLLSTVPEGFESFERVIEVVSQEALDRQSARLRWKYYTECGYDILQHELQLAS